MTNQQYQKAYNQYMNSLPSMKKSINTIKAYSLALRKFEDYLNGVEHLGDISPIDVVNFRTALANTGIKSNTIKQYLIGLHSFFESAIRMKLTEENPVQMEEIPKSDPIEYDLLNMDEIKTAIANTTPPKGMTRELFVRNRAIVVLFLQAGLRNSELRSLTPADLDFEKCTITVKHGKGDKKRMIAFPSTAREAVKEYLTSGVRPQHLTDKDWLFGSDCDKNGHSTYGKEWHQLSSYALLLMIRRYIGGCTGKENGVKVHALRHAFASVVAEIGVPIRTVQLALGHSSVKTTEKVYTRVLNRRAVAESINTALDNWGD
jgi:integrase/recombinase XerC